MSQAIQDLVSEHEAILSALDILEKMVSRYEANEKLEVDEMVDFIAFLREFADKCHHGKEEGMLFPAMVAAGVPNQGGPVGAMLMEHQQGRALIARMADNLENPAELNTVLQAARDYIFLMHGHIQKENIVLFPMADRVLSADTLASLFEGFEQHEETVIGHGRHEELHAILHRLEEKNR